MLFTFVLCPSAFFLFVLPLNEHGEAGLDWKKASPGAAAGRKGTSPQKLIEFRILCIVMLSYIFYIFRFGVYESGNLRDT